MSVPGYEPVDEQRWLPEPPKRPGRTEFARDRARLLHSAGWRRLAGKTQVVMAGQADFPRTRMTHSLEVAQVGRELGAALGCDPDLVETACLAHDLGHPPFGHNGEDALDAICAHIGGFEGNAQTLRVLTRLEAKAFGDPRGTGHERSLGLNLTRAALDAATKYPWTRQPGSRKFGVYADDMAVFAWMRAGAPTGARSMEAQVMDWADDIAYSVHDVEDGIHAGLIDLRALTDPQVRAELVRVTLAEYLPGVDPGAVTRAVERLLGSAAWPRRYAGSHADLAALKALTSRLIGRFSAAAQSATREAYPDALLTRHRGSLVVPEDVRLEVGALKGIAYMFVMRRRGSDEAYQRQQSLIHELVSALILGAPDVLEPHLQEAWLAATDDPGRLRVVIDQLASLTDRSVGHWHARLCR